MRVSLLALLLVGLFAAGGRSQEPGLPAAPFRCRTDRLEVKLDEASGAVLTASGGLASRSGVDLGRVASIFAEADRVERAVDLPLDLLDRWHREADERLPPGAVRPGHLGLWFRVHCADPARASAIRARLRAEPMVTYADHEPVPELAGAAPRPGRDDIPPPTPDLTSYQGYRGAAPTGFGFDATRWLSGARGDAATVFHIEVDWVWDHEDLALTPAHFVGQPTTTATEGANHGTAIIGVLYARRNGYGMTGVVDATDLRLVSVVEHGPLAQSIAVALTHARPGDVMTVIGGVNLQLTKPNDIVPYEYFPLNFDAIRTATARGVIFVESAANGDNDLDDPRFQRRFDLSARDSGAIMVGATDGSNPTRAPYSNYGSRIDANAWGYDVATLGYGTLFTGSSDLRQRYTERSAGTSSASALITGVVTSIISAVRTQQGRTVTGAEVRQLLRSHGTAVAGNIGRRPDLDAIFASLGLVDGLALDRAEVGLGEVLDVTVTGAAGSTAFVLLSPGTARVELGLGRPLLLDPGSTATAATLALTGTPRSWSVTLPNDPGLADLDLHMQGVVVDGTGGARLTSAVSFWVH